MAYNIGPKIGIDGEAEFRAEMERIAASVKAYNSELKLLDAQYGEDNKSLEKLTKQHTSFSQILMEQTDKVKQLENVVQASTEKYGESSKETQTYIQALNTAKIEVIQTTQALEENERAIKELSNFNSSHLDVLKELEAEYQENQKAVREESKAVKNLESDLKAAEAALKEAKKASSENSEAVKEQAEKVEKLRSALSKQESQLKKTTSETAELKEKMGQASDSLVKVTESTEKANKGFSGGIKSIGDLKSAILDSDPIIAALSDTIGTVVTKLADITMKAAAASDEINTLATQTGLSVEDIQKFRYASEMIDVSMDDLTGALSKTVKAMDEMKSGSGTAGQALNKLGIRLKDSRGQAKSASDVFNETIKALGKIKDPVERDATAMKIFGKSAQELNPLILGGADALKKYGDAMERSGMILSSEQLGRLNDMNDQIDIMKANYEQLGMVFSESTAESIVPALEDINNLLMDNVDALKALGKVTGLGVDFLSGIFEAAISPLKIVLDLTGKLDTALGKIEKTLGKFLNFAGKSLVFGTMGIPGFLINMHNLSKLKEGYDTGTSYAAPGLHPVAESAPEMVVSGGEAALVSSPSLMNFRGGERVYNGEQTRSLLASPAVSQDGVNRLASLLEEIKTKLSASQVNNVYVTIDPRSIRDIDQLLTYANEAQIEKRKRGW